MEKSVEVVDMIKNIKWGRLLSVAVLIIAFGACTKKRDAELAYGEDRDLYEIAAYEGKEFDLKTLEIIQAVESDKKLKISDSRSEQKTNNRNFGFVKYESQDPLKLTENTQMLGLENSTYKTKYFFQGDLLKVMKLAELKDLAPDEIPSAIDNKDGRYMVPIVSYEASFYKVDHKRNDYNEKTSRLELIALQSPVGATHFKIDFNTKKKAAFLPKTTVLPVSFFNSNDKDKDSKDWYYAVTFVNTAVQIKESYTGEHWSADKFGRTASRVRLDMNEKGLHFYNLNVDERLAEDIQNKKEHQASALVIPATFKSYKFEERGKTTNVKESANTDAAWAERQFIELNLGETLFPGSKEMKISEVIDLQIDDGYLSYLVKEEETNSIARISIYRVDAYKKNVAKNNGAGPYLEKKYLRDDQDVFGYFPIMRSFISDRQNSSKEEGDQRARLVRYNPNRKTIEYRLNQEAPEWAEEVFTKAISAWNATFQAAGSDLRIKYKDSHGKVLRGIVGDLRYSLVNFQAPLDSSNLSYLGFGPSIADLTGEIVMATSTINYKSYIDISESNLEAYLRSLKGDTELKSILGFSFPGLRSVVDTKEGNFYLFGADTNSKLVGNSKRFKFFDSETKMIRSDLKLILAKSQNASAETFGASESKDLTIPLTIESIEEHCPEFYQYSLQIKASKPSPITTSQERKLLSACATNISKPRLVSTLLHELGHNFGLRHNFYGSADIQNFYRPVQRKVNGKDKTINWYSSTVMDYLPFDEDSMVQPGPYDIAAIRWGYTGTVEVNGVGIVKSNESIPLKTQFANRLKTYKYCTDENVDMQTDPFCAKQDIGYDPEQAVESLIQKYEAHVAQYSYRNGSDKMLEDRDQAAYRAQAFIDPMLKFYEMWRLILSQEVGQERMYLDDVETKADYNELLSKVFAKSRNGIDRKAQAEWNEKYQRAGAKVFKFLMRIVLTPDYSCVTSREILPGENHIQLFSFTKVQSEIFGRTQKTVMNCADPAVKQYLKDTKGAEVVAEGGKSFDRIFADLNKVTGNRVIGESKVIPEVAGFAWDRLYALLALTQRVSYLAYSQRVGFTPNFMDELPYREAMATAFINRIAKGVDVDSLKLDRVLNKQIKPEQYAVSFAAEKPLLRLFMLHFKNAVAIEGKDSLNSKRLAPFNIQKRREFSEADELECIELYGSAFTGEYCAKKHHEDAVRLIKYLKEIEEIRKPWVPSQQAIDTVNGWIVKFFPENSTLQNFTYLPIGLINDEVEKLENSTLKEDIKRTVDKIFKSEDMIFLSATRNARIEIAKKGLVEVQAQEEINKIRSQPFLRYLQVYAINYLQKQDDEELRSLKSYEDYKPVDRKLALERLQRLVKTQARNKEIYLNDPAEWESKADILMSSLQ